MCLKCADGDHEKGRVTCVSIILSTSLLLETSIKDIIVRMSGIDFFFTSCVVIHQLRYVLNLSMF